MKTLYSIGIYKLICILFICGTVSVNAQEDSEILDAYEDYSESAREVVYMHLNKSTYITGESIGFTAYIMDKKDKKPSLLTTNLYVSIEDNNQNVVKQKLIRVDNGIASNSFELDSLFSSGYYNVKAYTNWMLNFNEQNHFTESIRIINPETEEYVEKQMITNEIDAQFLPESGHLLNGVINNIGVVIKDNQGFGIANAKGEVVDKNNEVLFSFETNQFGIGKFQLLADTKNRYKVNIRNSNKDFSFDLNQNIESKGIIMSLKSLKSKVFVSLITNSETLDEIKNKRHTLLIHNGDNYDIMDIYFTDQTVVTKAIEYSNSASGINILTLFNENDTPIAERLFFNYEGINVLTSNAVSATKSRDTVTINLNFKSIDVKAFNSLSVSVLPEETKSYNRHNNIISYTYLQPYIKGAIERAKYYFTDIDAKKQYELDNLLLTQGWSSYNWNDIFNNTLNPTHSFEQGIRLKANINVSKETEKQDYLMHAVSEDNPRIFNLKSDEKSFMIENLFPFNNDRLFFSKIQDNGELTQAQLYLQAFPSLIPKLKTQSYYLNPKYEYTITSSLNNQILFEEFNKVQRLKEVTISGKLDKKRTRIRDLSEHKFGRIKVIDDTDRTSFNTLTDYLKFYGLAVDESNGGFSVDGGYSYGLNNSSPANSGTEGRPEESSGISVDPDSSTLSAVTSGSMAIFLDDIQLVDASFLNQYSLSNVDYIEINRRGIGAGVRGARGVIKIYSNFGSTIPDNIKTIQQVDIPLTFSNSKTFYVPKYRYYADDFYKNYGVIDWNPNLVVDSTGNISIKIAQPKIPITLYIEGIANDGSFIFEEKSIALNKS